MRDEGATPATIAIVDGKIRIGLQSDELNLLSNLAANKCKALASKVSIRDIATCCANGVKIVSLQTDKSTV